MSQIVWPQAASLESAGVGTPLRVCGLEGSPSVCRRLRELGFCEEARVQKLSHCHLLLCDVCGTRLALDRHTARGIQVRPEELAS